DGDGDGDGDGVMCAELPQQQCDQYDPVTCVCDGCDGDGECTQDEDCVCPDCTNQNYCRGNQCMNDGLCHPYFEGCECQDCASHPQCN
ncbi:MAG: hypothetical protein KC468_28920, partial [Myxococcales bacterium]|nr:hypothetical protein [Myxococcales bacterium]